jgi:hypothetical protein
VGGGIAAALAGFELLRLALSGGRLGGLAPWLVILWGLTVFVVLALTAVGLALQKQFGWIAGAFAIVVSLSHGVILQAVGVWYGVPFLLGAAPLFYCLAKSLPAFRVPVVPVVPEVAEA